MKTGKKIGQRTKYNIYNNTDECIKNTKTQTESGIERKPKKKRNQGMKH